MDKQKAKTWRDAPADKLAGRVLIALVAATAVLFAAFFLIGFNTPFADDSNFNAPILTDALLWFVYLLLAAAVAVAVVAVVRGLRLRNKTDMVVNGIPAAKIARGSAILLVATLVVTFALGSSSPLSINGVDYTDTFWLKATDMFIYTSAVLLVVAVAAMGYGLSGRNRRVNGKGKD